jgi:uncharacterized protein
MNIMKKLVTLFVFAASLVSMQSFSQDNSKVRSINVNGVAELEIVPDEIYVQVELREYDKKGGGKVDIEDIKSRFLKDAVSVGIPETDISVQSYAGWDGNYWWYKKNKKKNPDMKASITYQVKLASTKKMDELVQKMDDEATQNFSIARVSHSKLPELKKQLKIQAVKAAKEKANYLAEAIGEKVGEALTINEPHEISVYPQPIYANRMMKAEAMGDAGGGAAPNVDFKKMKLQFEVNAIFALK